MKLNYKRTALIGFAFLSISAFWQLYDSVIPLMLKNTFQLGETLTGAIMAVDNVLALFLLPLFGAWSDRVDTRFGKRTPFIIIGTFFAVIFMMIIPRADQTVNFPMFFIALGATLLAMGSYRSPAVALMPDLTPKPLRSKANAVINLMGAVGYIIALGLISLLVKKESNPDYTIIFALAALLMVVSVVILILTIREKKLAAEMADSISTDTEADKANVKEATGPLPKEVMKSLVLLLASIFLWFTAYNAVTTAYSRYAGEVWGLTGGSFANSLMVAGAAAIVSYIPIGMIASTIGRKKTILIGILMMTISYFVGYLFVEYSSWINVVFAFTGIGWAAINVNSYPMVVEMSRRGDVGKYTGYYYTFSMAAQIFTPIFSGLLLEKISYRTLFPYAVVFSLLSFCTMLFVKHGDSKPPKKTENIEHFDVD
ncbi:MAG TPA: MFS transporter [Clostridiales bacterium]|nr:MFS transporter [Clostridia bacterium]MDD4681495.1 MFS transporter [Clostridia bacterium]HCS76113.1 MFS transporter [Clostridiales bacterium]